MAKKSGLNEVTQTLLERIKFVCSGMRPIGLPYNSHVRLMARTAVCSDDVITAGAVVPYDFNACPHAEKLILALSKCDDAVSVTQTEAGALSIRAGKFRAIVPCMNPAEYPDFQPDPFVLHVGDDFRQALVRASMFSVEGAKLMHQASILLIKDVCYGTNGFVLLESWHGYDIPVALVIPKRAIALLENVKSELYAIGASKNSITFYFKNDTWLKTQVYDEKWPMEQSQKMFDVMMRLVDPQPELFTAIESVLPFSENDRVYFDGVSIRSNLDPHSQDGARYEISGVPQSNGINGKALLQLKDIIKKIDFFSDPEKTFFIGDSVRGIIAAVKTRAGS